LQIKTQGVEEKRELYKKETRKDDIRRRKRKRKFKGK
jgi:hypothetical protein